MTGRGHQVRVYAESLSEIDWDDVLSSDLVGISTTTSTAIRAYRYAQRVRDAGIPVLMGGPHVTFLAEEAMDFCDYVVRNEGEQTLVELIEYLEGKGEVEDILGLTYRAVDGQVVHNPPSALTALPNFLARHDLGGRGEGESNSILASRGVRSAASSVPWC